MTDLNDPVGLRPLSEALGLLVIRFSALEESLHDAIRLTVGGSEDAVQALTAGMSFRNLVDKFGAVFRASGRLHPSQPEIAALCAHLSDLNDERNAIIHSSWAFWADSGAPMRTRRVSKLRVSSLSLETVDPAIIVQLAGRIQGAEDKLWEILAGFDMSQLGGNPPAS